MVLTGTCGWVERKGRGHTFCTGAQEYLFISVNYEQDEKECRAGLVGRELFFLLSQCFYFYYSSREEHDRWIA